MESTLQKELLRESPVTLQRYMELCLYHETEGYYNRSAPVGIEYTTSPEVSDMFGEVVALALIKLWKRVRRPIHLVELGPGRGTMMAQMLKVLENEAFFQDLEVHMVETSPMLSAIQAQNNKGRGIRWHRDLPETLKGFVVIVANEFFDAFPIDQYLFSAQNQKWYRRFVDVEKQKFVWNKAHNPPAIRVSRRRQEGEVVEFSHAVFSMVQKIGRVADLVLVMDYGYDTGTGDTLQSMCKGKRVPVLGCEPGTKDITAHVNFGSMRDQFRNMSFNVTLESQRKFLIANGIQEVFSHRCKAREAKGKHALEYARLTGPMGNLFKVLVATLT